MKNAITLHAWGVDRPITFCYGRYLDNNNIYIGMITEEDGYPVPWSDLTVNSDIVCALGCAYIDTNNNGDDIIEWLIANQLGIPTGNTMRSGYCVYPEFQFNAAELSRHLCD